MDAKYLLKKQMEQFNNEGGEPNLPELGDLIKLVNTLKKEDMLPAICFVFSKKRLTQIVQGLLSHVSLVDRVEQKKIEQIFHKAMRRLSPNERALREFTTLREILMKGIGIHHGDLLHIGKEVVEILLQKGLIKLLFATDSFAMGLNMPTKTVVFHSIKKFDGKELRFLLSSEYTQMAGRAGRRGLDEKGKVITFIAEQRDIPEEKDLMNILNKQGESLESKFKLSYNILFNALGSQVVELEDIMNKSFGQDQNFV